MRTLEDCDCLGGLVFFQAHVIKVRGKLSEFTLSKQELVLL